MCCIGLRWCTSAQTLQRAHGYKEAHPSLVLNRHVLVVGQYPMPPPFIAPLNLTRPCWRTAALGDGGSGHPLEQAALGEHLRHCRGSAGRAFAWHCGAEAVHAFVLARFITSALAILVLVAAGAWLITW